MSKITCPTCKKLAEFRTITKGTYVTFSMKCNECNRRVIKNGKRDDYNVLRRIAIETWQGKIDEEHNHEDL